VSISPIFFEQLFRIKVFLANFYVLTIWVCNFWQKDFGAKAANKMLVKLTPGGRSNNKLIDLGNHFKGSIYMPGPYTY